MGWCGAGRGRQTTDRPANDPDTSTTATNSQPTGHKGQFPTNIKTNNIKNYENIKNTIHQILPCQILPAPLLTFWQWMS